MGAPGRREIGHGNLAERGLRGALPTEAEFPYTIRVESLITESCGSSRYEGVRVRGCGSRRAGQESRPHGWAARVGSIC